MNAIKRLAQPFRPLSLGGVAGIFMVAALLLSMEFWSGSFGPFDLRDLILHARSTLPALALPVGWIAVWAAAAHNRTSAIVGAAPGRARDRIVARQAALLSASAGSGWLAGWAVPGGVAVVTQSWSPIDVLAMLTLTAAVASLVTISFATAMLLGARMGAFLVPVVLLGVLLLPAFWFNDELLMGKPASTMALAYVWSVSVPRRGQQLVLGTEALRLAFYLLVAFTTTMAAAGLAEFRATSSRRRLTSATWLAFPLSASVVVSLVMPLLYTPDLRDQVRCRTESGYTLCLYAIEESRRTNIAQDLAPLIRLLPTTRAKDLVVTQDAHKPEEIEINRRGADRAAWLANDLPSLARSLILPSSSSCDSLPDETRSDSMDLRTSVLRQFSVRAAKDATDPTLAEALRGLTKGESTSAEADERLGALTSDQFREWYGTNLGGLNECSLTDIALP